MTKLNFDKNLALQAGFLISFFIVIKYFKVIKYMISYIGTFISFSLGYYYSKFLIIAKHYLI